MANQWEIEDQRRRQKVAAELDRRTFWKNVYIAEVAAGRKQFALSVANNALCDFDNVFKALE